MKYKKSAETIIKTGHCNTVKCTECFLFNLHDGCIDLINKELSTDCVNLRKELSIKYLQSKQND